MDKIEVTGRTLEEALQLAAQQLGVSANAVEYEIVEEGSHGFLGLGQTPTVLQAWAQEGAEKVAAPPPAIEPEVEEVEVQEETIQVESLETAATEEIEIPREEPVKTEASGDADAFAEAVTDSLSQILKPMKVDAKPVVKSIDDEEIIVDIVGSDTAILIGRRGATLDALQYLVGIIANRRVPGRRRVILDAERYRERHNEMLERKAIEYAKAVKQEGKEAVLEPQPARDRRVIHLTLADNPDVYTYSEGEGDDRHVVISPKK